MQEKGVQTLNRVLDIIELLAEQREGIGVTEIGQALGLHKSTVHRMLNALAERGYIEKDPKYSTYKIGLKFIEISSLSLNKLELKTEARPFIRKLAETVGQPVHLAILDGMDAVYIDKVEAVNSIRMYSQIGKRVPVYCSALGKVLLSGLKNDERKTVISKLQFVKMTSNTIDSPERLEEEVQKAIERGWALDNEEHEEGIRCIAAPVYDYAGKIIAAVSVSGDKTIINSCRDDEISSLVIETAKNISHRMGHI